VSKYNLSCRLVYSCIAKKTTKNVSIILILRCVYTVYPVEELLRVLGVQLTGVPEFKGPQYLIYNNPTIICNIHIYYLF